MKFKNFSFFAKVAIIFGVADIVLAILAIFLSPFILWIVKGSPWWTLLNLATVPFCATAMVFLTGYAKKGPDKK